MVLVKLVVGELIWLIYETGSLNIVNPELLLFLLKIKRM